MFHSQSWEVIIRVYNVMKKEAEQGNCIKLNKVQSHVPDATGASFKSIEHILCEYKKNLSCGSSFSMLCKNMPW